jgi:hypothetical protein
MATLPSGSCGIGRVFDGFNRESVRRSRVISSERRTAPTILLLWTPKGAGSPRRDDELYRETGPLLFAFALRAVAKAPTYQVG